MRTRVGSPNTLKVSARASTGALSTASRANATASGTNAKATVKPDSTSVLIRLNEKKADASPSPD